MDLDFELAWKRVKCNAEHDFLLAGYEYAAYDFAWDANRDRLFQLLNADEPYQPRELRKIDVPKGRFMTRPWAIPEISDRIIYQALVDAIAPTIEPKLTPVEDRVLFSNRLSEDPTDPKMFLNPRTQWRAFRDATLAEFESASYTHLVATDVSAYYEYINIMTLQNQLANFGCPNQIVQALIRMLKRWSNCRMVVIPQGPMASDYLANLYMDTVDKYLVRAGHRYLRYVDDIYVLTRSETDAHRALHELGQELRHLGLVMQTQKTQVIPASEVRSCLCYVDSRLEQLRQQISAELIDVGPYWGWDWRAEPNEDEEEMIEDEALRTFFDEEVISRLAVDRPDRTHLRYCLNRFGKAGDDYAVSSIDGLLRSMPDETYTCARYLIRLGSKSYPAGWRAVLAMLRSSEYLIYPWQEMWLLQYLLSARQLPPDAVTLIRNIISDHSRHPIVRARAMLVLGKLGDTADLQFIKSTYNDEYSLVVRKAAIVALQRLAEVERNRFYAMCTGASLELDQVVEWCKQHASDWTQW